MKSTCIDTAETENQNLGPDIKRMGRSSIWVKVVGEGGWGKTSEAPTCPDDQTPMDKNYAMSASTGRSDQPAMNVLSGIGAQARNSLFVNI